MRTLFRLSGKRTIHMTSPLVLFTFKIVTIYDVSSVRQQIGPEFYNLEGTPESSHDNNIPDD